MNGYYALIAICALIGSWGGYRIQKNEKGGLGKVAGVLACAILGGIVGGVLCIVPGIVSYFKAPSEVHVANLEIIPEHEYYIELDEGEGLYIKSVTFLVDGQIHEETGTVLYDLDTDETPYMEETTFKNGWFQHLFPAARDVELRFHVRSLGKERSWFVDQLKAIESIESQIDGLRQPSTLAGYAPPVLISQAVMINEDQITSLIVQRDILAATYNKEAAMLDEQSFYDQTSITTPAGRRADPDLPYKVELVGTY